MYEGITMVVVGCSRCEYWEGTRCSVNTGAEHLPDVAATEIPACPLETRCQHQLQASPLPCVIRSKGMVCESALVHAGMSRSKAMDHPLSFHAHTVASPEELEERLLEESKS